MREFENIHNLKAQVFNVGGGQKVSTSLLELTNHCQNVTGNSINISSDLNTANVDIPYYITDYDFINKTLNWEPKVSIEEIVKDIYCWIKKEQDLVSYIFN